MTNFRVYETAHTGVTVSDIDRSIAFYRNVLGFDVTDKVHCEGAFFGDATGLPGAQMDIAFVSAPGHRIELVQYLNPQGTKSELQPSDPGFMHISFTVENIDAIVDAVTKAGFTTAAKTAPTYEAEGGLSGWRAIYTRDPDGIVLEFMEPPKA